LNEDKKRMVKEIIKQLHSGLSPQEIKEKFKQVLEAINPLEIAIIEQELIKEGVAREEIQKLCDVHLAIFREQLEKQKFEIPSWHPINILMEEHKIMLKLSEELINITNRIRQVNDIIKEMHNIKHLSEEFRDSEKHYLREENVLFPYLERHSITEPPAIMWMEHNQIREVKKNFYNLIENYNTMGFKEVKRQFNEVARSLSSLLANHFFKENSILFPTALQVITEQEWINIKKDFDEIGYCCFTPEHLITMPTIKDVKKVEAEPLSIELAFETGKLSKREIEAILNTLPIDITFVDKEDTVKYFNKGEERIFIRTKAVIGRRVQQCHPQKSIHIVNKILDAFRSGKRDVAEFWIQKDGRVIHIRYFAVRDKNGEYLGTIEVTQDITDIKKIEGEKRLLDWKD
jgi:PAS domain S-box-containing protein